eukprot:2531864-Heterocapsa_arctica.AAC.1
MLKAKQIQLHKRAKTTKSGLNKDENGKRDEEDTENMNNMGEVILEGNSNVNKQKFPKQN